MGEGRGGECRCCCVPAIPLECSLLLSPEPMEGRQSHVRASEAVHFDGRSWDGGAEGGAEVGRVVGTGGERGDGEEETATTWACGGEEAGDQVWRRKAAAPNHQEQQIRREHGSRRVANDA
jgi:outer membrane lipoprotein SlyB